jgi:hypothetical protein
MVRQQSVPPFFPQATIPSAAFRETESHPGSSISTGRPFSALLRTEKTTLSIPRTDRQTDLQDRIVDLQARLIGIRANGRYSEQDEVVARQRIAVLEALMKSDWALGLTDDIPPEL